MLYSILFCRHKRFWVLSCHGLWFCGLLLGVRYLGFSTDFRWSCRQSAIDCWIGRILTRGWHVQRLFLWDYGCLGVSGLPARIFCSFLRCFCCPVALGIWAMFGIGWRVQLDDTVLWPFPSTVRMPVDDSFVILTWVCAAFLCSWGWSHVRWYMVVGMKRHLVTKLLLGSVYAWCIVEVYVKSGVNTGYLVDLLMSWRYTPSTPNEGFLAFWRRIPVVAYIT